MKTILVCNQKGGVGKTLIADEIAFCLERDDIPYNFYDMDGQDSAIHVTKEVDDAEVQVIDTPGSLQEDLTKWVEASDFVIVPTLMSNRDMGPLIRMIEILQPYIGKKPIVFVFNRWNRYNATKDFINWFESEYPDLKTAVINDSTAFNVAGAYGKSVVEHKGNSEVARQIQALYGSIKYELNIKEKWRTKKSDTKKEDRRK
ncbi:MAG: ParA family protein [Agathobacter sp.]|nr:ParA family protein [Agathobacter sp.]